MTDTDQPAREFWLHTGRFWDHNTAIALHEHREAYWSASDQEQRHAEGTLRHLLASRKRKRLENARLADIHQATAAKKYKLGPLSHVAKLIWGALFNHIGMLVVVALYYIVFETTPGMKHLWDDVICPNGHLRHTIRDVAEGVLGGFLAKGIMWNHYTKSGQKAGRIFDFLHDKVKIPAHVAALLSSATFFAASFWAGDTILNALHVHAANAYPSGDFLHRTATLWNSDWDKKALGLICALISVRPMHSVFDDVQTYFAGRRAALGRQPFFFYPKAFKNRYIDLAENLHEVRTYTANTRLIMSVAVVAAVGLAGYGLYILDYVA
jgi:hypothetical protein